jgi:catechol 2,3-dioxygenase-like lactoylglutathione lyase family enzyme
MVKGLHHVEIYVSDLKKSREFWKWFLGELGYTLFQEWDMGFSMLLDPTYIVFVQTEERFLDKNYHRCQTGLNHLAFHADSRQAVDNMTEKVRTKGMKILYEDRHPFAGGEDYYALYFEDPDRIKVELVAP